jgi:hypothetical protein
VERDLPWRAEAPALGGEGGERVANNMPRTFRGQTSRRPREVALAEIPVSGRKECAFGDWFNIGLPPTVATATRTDRTGISIHLTRQPAEQYRLPSDGRHSEQQMKVLDNPLNQRDLRLNPDLCFRL